MATAPETPVAYPEGQRLQCPQCGSALRITSRCACQPPDQSLICCGEPMRPVSGDVGLEGIRGPDDVQPPTGDVPGLPFEAGTSFQAGQRVQCESCGAEVEIERATPADPPRQSLRCCGADMVPVEGNPRRLQGE